MFADKTYKKVNKNRFYLLPEKAMLFMMKCLTSSNPDQYDICDNICMVPTKDHWEVAFLSSVVVWKWIIFIQIDLTWPPLKTELYFTKSFFTSYKATIAIHWHHHVDTKRRCTRYHGSMKVGCCEHDNASLLWHWRVRSCLHPITILYLCYRLADSMHVYAVVNMPWKSIVTSCAYLLYTRCFIFLKKNVSDDISWELSWSLWDFEW